MIARKAARYLLLSLLLVLLLCITSYAVIFVATDGNDANDGLSWGSPKQTIQAGVDAADLQPDKIVWVEKNTLLVPAYQESIDVPTGVYIYGGFDGDEVPGVFNLNDRVFVPETVVEPDPGDPTVPVFTTSGNNRIDGFSVQDSEAPAGGAIDSIGNLFVANCIIQDNISILGAGIYAEDGYVSIDECAFIFNTAIDDAGETTAQGGAIWTENVTLLVTDTEFTANVAIAAVNDGALLQGGAVYASGGSSVRIERCEFNGNYVDGTLTFSTGWGGAVYASGVNTTLRNNFFWNNSVFATGKPECAYGGAIAFRNQGTFTLVNNTFYANSVTPQAGDVDDLDRPYGLGSCVFLLGSANAYIYNNIFTQSRGTALVSRGMVADFNYNILWHNAGGDLFGISFPLYSTDPLLNKDFNIMRAPQLRDPRSGDLHILYGSPGRDTGRNSGAPSQDIDLESRPNYSGVTPQVDPPVVDIGADEYVDTDIPCDGGADNDPTPPAGADTDNDLIDNAYDNCFSTPNQDQTDSNDDGTGDACTPLASEASPLAYYVDSEIASSGDGTTWATAFKTIQEAVDAADSHNQAGWSRNYVVWVRGDAFTPPGGGQDYLENVMIWHGVSVYGAFSDEADPSDNPSPYSARDFSQNQTRIDGDKMDTTVVMAHLPQDRYLPDPLKSDYAAAITLIDSFKIQNGNGELGGGVSVYKDNVNISSNLIEENEARLGGGVYMYNTGGFLGDGWTPPPATLLTGDTTIFYNIADGDEDYAGYGGGVYIERGAPSIFANLVEGNIAFWGGGLAVRRASPSLVENLIGCASEGPPSGMNAAVGTDDDGKGGGIYMDTNSYVSMDKLTIVANLASGAEGQGGGLYASDSDFIMKNTIVADNTAGHTTPAQNGGAIYIDGLSSVSTDPWCFITYSDFFNNSEEQFVGLIDPTTPPPPLPYPCRYQNLALDPLFVDPDTCAYNLQPTSPLLGAGDPEDGSPNIGAFQEEDPPVSVAEAKKLNNGVIVEISDAVVTAVFNDGFYIEDLDRTSGIRVLYHGAPVYVGQPITVTGVMSNNGFEKHIVRAEITTQFARFMGHIDPVVVSNKDLGGGRFGDQPAVWGPKLIWVGERRQRVNAPSSGLSNVGLLVRTTGRVSEVHFEAGPFITIDDGSGTPVRVIAPKDTELPKIGDYVVVTGISTVYAGEDGHPYKAVRVRSGSEIVYPHE